MKYFLDSAKLDEIKIAYEQYGFDGVTTNPKHIMNSGKPFKKAIQDIADYVADKPDFPVSVEINPHLDNADDMVAYAKDISAISKNFVIKIPTNKQGIIAARRLEAQGIRTNMTLVFSAAQSIMPGKLHAKYVSPFVGWREDYGDDGLSYVKDIVDIYKTYNFDTEIIVAAIRTAKQLEQAAIYGADIVTCALSVYETSFTNPYTDLGLKTFQDAWDNTKTE
ncbi:transaldolase family protein [Secundilactobacillus collinoides]|uniref:Transaldolase n=2 Tax=Secundilactobacillus collinoides TaxID=33960 RepID=A0A0R2B2I3_SECCO|nr:transaldolase family protein [Secundilactobacillus collinoides]KRM73757.1 Transaldolase [Secundilactobacillus collinoides DSM 20515 = JCM 1123]KZL35945.1 transaldolase [Secundilactobacillus collinoides]